eukprot:GHVL01005823.1.p1 GENE.GHVL01005823.1~~GHVL01005823.1.p1  ORF type:complete len:205 (+),score=47.91 GHVL01005823.1:85-699(+)
MVQKGKKNENQKAVDAKARKAAVLNEKKAENEKRREEEEWKDADKSVNSKLERMKANEAKLMAQKQRKLENKEMYEKEIASLVKKSPVKPARVTQHEIRQKQEEESSKPPLITVEDETPLTENPNLNRPIDALIATDVDGALAGLEINEVDSHPERRRKAGHLAYEEHWMPILRAEHPSLNRGQLKHMIFERWQTAPENPTRKI